LRVLAGITFFDGVDQSDDSGVNQIIHRDMRRQPVMNPPGDVFHLR